MINREDRQVLYKFIKLDMAIKSLQRDYDSLTNLKMSKVYLDIVDRLLKDLRHDYYNKKRFLAKQKIEVVKWVKISEHFSEVTIRTPGEDEVHQYANQALKTHTEELIFTYLKEINDNANSKN
ncbi:aconitate hydratase [Lysinibacillus sp. FSL K6-0075]|uniref:aconitate hydratase n=1 Tax=Lysinibacillus sp. FSL K6-0075 TaxID=2921415 RepID=UPI003158A122